MVYNIPPLLDGSPAVANAVRCSIMDFVETFAITSVTIRANQSVMTDEQLAHRLGLIVFKSEGTIPELLYLSSEAPASSRLCVSSDDLRTSDQARPPLADEHPIPLVMLGPGEKIDIECKLEKKNGRSHTRHSPVNVVKYKERGGKIQLELEPTGAIAEKKIIEQACLELILHLRRARAQLQECL